MSRYLSATQVTEMLGISAATLYSYVSRGLIRSEEAGDDHRARRYHAEDVERLLRRKAGRRDPAKSAREALHWGEPVLESAITLIAEGKLYYRGQDATALARTQTFEGVAALLWAGEGSRRSDPQNQPDELFERAWSSALPQWQKILDEVPYRTALAAMQAVLARGGEDDLAGYELDMGSVIGTGGRILRLLTKVCSRYATGTTTAERLAAGWKTPHARLLDAALILCADHELNVSSFAARVIASTGATPYAVVAGALAALSGHKHGGHTRRVAVLLDEIEQYGDFNAVIRSRLARGDGIPGFEHRLYPDGDPRAAALLAMMSETVPEVADRLRVTESIIRHETGKLPNIDYALVTLERLLGLPQDAAFMLFAIGRSAGWIAHAIEQYARPELLRPRAKYVGAMPPI